MTARHGIEGDDMDQTPTERTQEIWVLAGQSNMIGYGPKGSELGPEWWTSPPNAKLFSERAWAPLLPTEGSFGPEIGFGHRMAAARPDRDFMLIKPRFGLGSLQEDWRSPNTGRGPAGPFYDALKTLVTSALADIPSTGIAGMLWMHGEADSHNDPAKAAAYEANLTFFIEALRKDFAAPEMPFLFGQISTSPTWLHHATLRQAQANVGASVGGATVFDTDDLPFCEDGIHYNTAGSLELGLRFANAVLGA